MKVTIRKPNAYDRGQHQLICEAMGVSDDPKHQGLTAYEAVCNLILKARMARRVLNGQGEHWDALPCYTDGEGMLEDAPENPRGVPGQNKGE